MKIVSACTSIGSVAVLAKSLSVDEVVLRGLAAGGAENYGIRPIPKKSGGFRTISDPSPTLKLIQRRIVRRLLSKCQFPDYLFGSVKDEANPRDFVRNAQAHALAKEVVAFDIESFFPSIRPGHVHDVFKYLFRFPKEVADILTELTTVNNSVPQGAPTSSYLANLIFHDVEHKVVAKLRAQGFIYTRLIDDITVSSSTLIERHKKRDLYSEIKNLLKTKGLEICHRKYQISNTQPAGKKTVVTGLVVEKGIVKLPKSTTKEIACRLHELKHRSDRNTTEPEYHTDFNKLSGLVALYSRLDPVNARPKRQQLRAMFPTYERKKVKKICWLCRKFIAYGKSHPAQHDEEGYARKYYKFKYKLSIIGRTSRVAASVLDKQLRAIRPTRLLASYHE